MSELIKLIEGFLNEPKKKFDIVGWERNDVNTSDNQPISKEEALKFRPYRDKPMNFSFIPEALYNKKIKIGDYSIFIQYRNELQPHNGDFSEYSSLGYRSESYQRYVGCNIVLCYEGIYEILGKYRSDVSIRLYNALPTQTNWSWLKIEEPNNYFLKEDMHWIESSSYVKIKDIINNIINSDVEITNDVLDYQEWYEHSDFGSKKKLYDYTLEEIDYNSFITRDIKDGVYKPENNNIEVLIKYSKLAKKSLLKSLGVHTVHLRSNAYFDVPELFSLDGIALKAPKSVIKAYNLGKYCVDEKVIKELEVEKNKKRKQIELEKYNNQFTLMQHGKVLLENKDRGKIIEFLENVMAKNLSNKIFDVMQPIFDSYPIDKFYLLRWGQYYNYESKGETCDIDFDCDGVNSKIIDENILEDIYSLYDKQIFQDLDISSREIEIMYGWPEMEIDLLAIVRGKRGKLEIVIEKDESWD